MLIRAALEGMGAAIGRPTVIAPELREGTVVLVFDSHSEVHSRAAASITTSAARRKPEIQAFSEGVLQDGC